MQQLRRVGIRSLDVSPDVVALTRRDDVDVQALSDSLTLVKDTDRRLTVHEMAPGTTVLVEQSLARRHRHDADKAVSAYLADEQIRHVLSKYRANVVIDVGANRGQYARALRRTGYKGWIVSFEPVLLDYEALVEAAARDPRWTVHQLALGDCDGTIEMNVVPGTLSSALPATTFGG